MCMNTNCIHILYIFSLYLLKILLGLTTCADVSSKSQLHFFHLPFFLLSFCVHVHVNLSLHVVFLQNEDMKYLNYNLAIEI